MFQPKRSISATLLALILVGLALVLAPPAGDPAAAQILQPPLPTQPSTTEEVQLPSSPDISNLVTLTPNCYKTHLRSDTCYVSWYRMTVQTTAPARMRSLTITIDGKLRANFQGFFQSSFTLVQGIFNPGFQVSCGSEGSGGVAGMGRTYNYTIYAVDSNSSSISNTGNVVCPANNLLRTYLPVIKK